MTDETGAPAEAISIVTAEAGTPAELTMNHAAKALADMRAKRNEQPAESAPEATAETELADEANTAPHDEAHGEDEGPDPAAEPPIERPKSWTESEEAEWRATPRALQQKIAARELERDTTLRRAQNEAAEKLKGLTVKEQQAEQVKQQYEAKLADQMQALLEYNNQQFSAVKSQADVDYLANEALRLSQSTDAGERDLSRQYTAFLNAWQVHQMKMAGKKAELDEAEGRKTTEKQNKSRERKQREDSLLIEKAPEYADAAKLDAAQKAAAALFREKGFTDDDLVSVVDDNPILDDHRMQLIIDDARKYRDLMKAPKAVAKPDLPPVQRPGTSKPSGGVSERTQALEKTLTNTGSIKDAAALLMARRNRRAS